MTIVDGRIIDKPLWWEPGDVGTRQRKAPVRAVVWHWTGGMHDAQSVVSTLRNRKNRRTGNPEPLSIHYVIERGGRTVQCADHSTVAYHAGKANSWSIGVEIVGGPSVDFTPEQYLAIGVLAETLPVPRKTFVVGMEIGTFSGHMEHRHLTPTKTDAGERVMRFLAAQWAGRLDT